MRNTTFTIVRVIILPSGSISENCPVHVLEIIISFIKTENCNIVWSEGAAKPTDKCQLLILEAARSTSSARQRRMDPKLVCTNNHLLSIQAASVTARVLILIFRRLCGRGLETIVRVLLVLIWRWSFWEGRCF